MKLKRPKRKKVKNNLSEIEKARIEGYNQAWSDWADYHIGVLGRLEIDLKEG